MGACATHHEKEEAEAEPDAESERKPWNAEEMTTLTGDLAKQMREVRRHARGIMTSPWIDERVRPAMALINEIAAFYGRDALFDPESMQRTDRPERTR